MRILRDIPTLQMAGSLGLKEGRKFAYHAGAVANEKYA
jgi:hypothetical protein